MILLNFFLFSLEYSSSMKYFKNKKLAVVSQMYCKIDSWVKVLYDGIVKGLSMSNIQLFPYFKWLNKGLK